MLQMEPGICNSVNSVNVEATEVSYSYLIRFSFNLLPSDRKTKGGVLCVNAK